MDFDASGAHAAPIDRIINHEESDAEPKRGPRKKNKKKKRGESDEESEEDINSWLRNKKKHKAGISVMEVPA